MRDPTPKPRANPGLGINQSGVKSGSNIMDTRSRTWPLAERNETASRFLSIAQPQPQAHSRQSLPPKWRSRDLPVLKRQYLAIPEADGPSLRSMSAKIASGGSPRKSQELGGAFSRLSLTVNPISMRQTRSCNPTCDSDKTFDVVSQHRHTESWPTSTTSTEPVNPYDELFETLSRFDTHVSPWNAASHWVSASRDQVNNSIDRIAVTVGIDEFRSFLIFPGTHMVYQVSHILSLSVMFYSKEIISVSLSTFSHT